MSKPTEAPNFEDRLKVATQIILSAKRILLLLSCPASVESDQQLSVQMIKFLDILEAMRTSGLHEYHGPICFVDGDEFRVSETLTKGYEEMSKAWSVIQVIRFQCFNDEEMSIAVNRIVNRLNVAIKSFSEFSQLATMHDRDCPDVVAMQLMQLRMDREATDLFSEIGDDKLRLPEITSDEDENLRKVDLQRLLANCHGDPPHSSTVSKWSNAPTFPKPVGKRGRSNLYNEREVLAWAKANTSYRHVADTYPKEADGQ